MKFLASIAFVIGLVAASVHSLPTTCEVNHKLTGEQHRVDCLLDPETTIGPYHLALDINRSNITEGKPGVPLLMNFVVMNTLTCEPIRNATVDIWHAEALGTYSGFQQEGTLNQTWLRGVQTTDMNGEVNFRSIYPGWYTGRCIHIHIAVYTDDQFRHVGQLFFTNAVTQSVRSAYPYNTRTDTPMSNEQDGIYNGSGGASTIFDGPAGSIDTGFSTVMYVGINPNVVIRP